jgi:hypothetical protein
MGSLRDEQHLCVICYFKLSLYRQQLTSVQLNFIEQAAETTKSRLIFLVLTIHQVLPLANLKYPPKSFNLTTSLVILQHFNSEFRPREAKISTTRSIQHRYR